MNASARAVLGGVAVVVLAACGPDPAGGPHNDAELAGELIVFAAASLTDAFEALADAFTDEHPGVTVVFNFAGSQVLAGQISAGAPADVFAAANPAQMHAVTDGGLAGADPVVFASNLLAIAVETGNPFGIAQLRDLADPELVVVLPGEEVPAGRYARDVLDAAGVQLVPASLEQDPRAALSKVELGEADAAIVYASDVVAADGRVDGVEIPAEVNVVAAYPIVTLADAPNPPAARAFMAFVLGPPGQQVLAAHGFMPP